MLSLRLTFDMADAVVLSHVLERLTGPGLVFGFLCLVSIAAVAFAVSVLRLPQNEVPQCPTKPDA